MEYMRVDLEKERDEVLLFDLTGSSLFVYEFREDEISRKSYRFGLKCSNRHATDFSLGEPKFFFPLDNDGSKNRYRKTSECITI